MQRRVSGGSEEWENRSNGIVCLGEKDHRRAHRGGYDQETQVGVCVETHFGIRSVVHKISVIFIGIYQRFFKG